ncbi:hypothetical protein BCAR13_300003 [Paraburkholderia caribensis]|nr:hypothetical protein BCAR13_300003 [Paraburkholderia caribensis]
MRAVARHGAEPEKEQLELVRTGQGRARFIRLLVHHLALWVARGAKHAVPGHLYIGGAAENMNLRDMLPVVPPVSASLPATQLICKYPSYA